MICSTCFRSIDSLSNYYSSTECRECYNQRMRNWQYNNYHKTKSAFSNRIGNLYKEIICEKIKNK